MTKASEITSCGQTAPSVYSSRLINKVTKGRGVSQSGHPAQSNRFDSQHFTNLGMVTHTHNPSTREAEGKGPQVQGHSQILSKF